MARAIFICPERARLGRDLRKLRQASSLRLADASPKVGVTASTLSRMEGGHLPVRADYLTSMLDLYGVDDQAERKRLAELAREGIHPPGWHAKATAERVKLHHRIEATCPLMCLDGLIPANVFAAVKQYLRVESQIVHPTVADFIELYQKTQLVGVYDQGQRGRDEVRRLLNRTRLVQRLAQSGP